MNLSLLSLHAIDRCEKKCLKSFLVDRKEKNYDVELISTVELSM